MNAEIAKIIDWYKNAVESGGGYPLIAALMAAESTVLPIPSEAVIPFAAWRAHVSGNLSITGVVLAGTAGSWIGATIMYWACRWAGRPLVLAYGRYLGITEPKVHAAEQWAARFGAFGVFVARLLPIIRHLIGIPMGIVKMDFRLYSIFTLLGSALWCSVLAWVGVAVGTDEKVLHGDVIRILLWLLGLIAVLGSLYYFLVHRFMRKPKA